MHPDQMNEMTSPIATVKPNAISNAAGEAEQQRAIAETQAAMIIAKKFPRIIGNSLTMIVDACKRPQLAEQAVYEYARGGTEISGPSIRLAESMAQAWGNMQYGIRELSSAGGESTVEAFAWDIETNVRQVKIFQVKHHRHTRKGGYTLTDPRDIYELVANNGARRLRACILGVIPGDVQETALKQCEATILANVDLSKESIDKLLEAFANFNVTQKMIEKRIQRDIGAITSRNVLALRRIYTSLKDGMGKIDDYFDESMIASDAAAPKKDEKPKKEPALKKEPEKKPEPEVKEKEQVKDTPAEVKKEEPKKEEPAPEEKSEPTQFRKAIKQVSFSE